MPKSKEYVSDSDSDSGSDKAPAPKKSRPSKTESKPSKTEDSEKNSWHLENKRFIKVREFKGRVMVDIREFYEKDGELKPGKKGISLSAAQWKKLTSFVNEVDEAVKEMA